MFQAGTLPAPSTQYATGMIVVHPPVEKPPSRVILYARVSSHDQKPDLARQLERLRSFAASKGLTVSAEVSDIGSGLNAHRKNLLKLLSDPKATTIVVEHQDRLARFGAELIAASLASAGRSLVVMNDSEFKDDLIQDFVDVTTCLCARIYGRRSSRNRAQRALEAAAKAAPDDAPNEEKEEAA